MLLNTFLAAPKLNHLIAQTDNIAVVIKAFILKKRADWLQQYRETYIVSIAINKYRCSTPSNEFNVLPSPKVRRGQTVTVMGVRPLNLWPTPFKFFYIIFHYVYGKR